MATIGLLASVHIAAVTEDAVEVPWWESLVDGVAKPMVQRGACRCWKNRASHRLNDEEMKKHLKFPGYFEPTAKWDMERAGDRLWS